MKLIKRIFNRKNKEINDKKIINNNIKNNMNLSNDQKVIRALKNKVRDSEIKDENLYIKDIDLIIETHVSQINKDFIQVIFILKNKVFDEDLFECSGGIGSNLNDAIESAVDNFLLSSLSGITHALKNEKGDKFKIKYYDEINEFTLYKSCLVVQGDGECRKTIDYWDTLGEEIKKRLGNKRVYYVKVYVSKIGELINCECRINGKVNVSLSKIINKNINNWDIESTLYSEKQIFILIQTNNTYVPYSFNKMHVSNIIINALDLYKQCDSDEKYSNLYTEIFNFCVDNTLTTDLFYFIPEIFCEFMFPEVKYSDEIIILKGNEKVQLFKEQIMSYNFIHDIAEKTIKGGYFKNNEIMNIVFKSSLFNSINRALNSGSKMERICTEPLAFNVRDDYKIF
ncbi:DUF6348 family protein [Clostridium taeniosporum]|uniref:Uncharacterized protein n=1 Tax=Clostridium taeniosporum TaxID=394958 RepID=A0A1D7XJ48_9CLOT|nr:DUF6348 family protein [Clostridium taeniosporum]AOR23363.1 hypothetical protein BGI42_06280 [Clostridium taeniosporum]